MLVFKSADPDYFISHVDLTRIAEYREEAAKLSGEASIAVLFRHLSASRLVTIAQIKDAFDPQAASSCCRATCASPRESLRRSRSSNLPSVSSPVAAPPSISHGSWAGRAP